MSQILPFGITVTGEVHSIVVLSAKFQIKARDYGLNDSESLAIWIEGNKQKITTYFGSRLTDYQRDLNSGKTKLKSSPKIWSV